MFFEPYMPELQRRRDTLHISAARRGRRTLDVRHIARDRLSHRIGRNAHQQLALERFGMDLSRQWLSRESLLVPIAR
jgi:hypothetical protein